MAGHSMRDLFDKWSRKPFKVKKSHGVIRGEDNGYFSITF